MIFNRVQVLFCQVGFFYYLCSHKSHENMLTRNMIRTLALVLAAVLATACGNKGNKSNTTQIMQNEECLICGEPLEYLE